MNEDIDETLSGVDWEAARVPTQPVDEERAAASPIAEEDHAEPDEPGVVEDGEALRELTEDGQVDQGKFGDGAYAPSHWFG